MNTKEKLNKLSEIIRGLSELYAELSEELSENCLRIAYYGARGNSEVKKMPVKYSCFRVQRRRAKTKKGGQPYISRIRS